jgi:hypothetical protein
MRVSMLLWSALAQLAALNGHIYVAAEPAALGARGLPTVDLGYSVYQGTYDSTSKLNIFKGYVSTTSTSIGHPD